MTYPAQPMAGPADLHKGFMIDTTYHSNGDVDHWFAGFTIYDEGANVVTRSVSTIERFSDPEAAAANAIRAAKNLIDSSEHEYEGFVIHVFEAPKSDPKLAGYYRITQNDARKKGAELYRGFGHVADPAASLLSITKEMIKTL